MFFTTDKLSINLENVTHIEWFAQSNTAVVNTIAVNEDGESVGILVENPDDVNRLRVLVGLLTAEDVTE